MNEYKQNEDTITLWARVGMTIKISPSALKRLQAGDNRLLMSILLGNSEEGRAVFSGDTYFPDIKGNESLAEQNFDL